MRIVLPPMPGFGYVKIVKVGGELLPKTDRESNPDAAPERTIATPPEKEQT